MDAQLNKNCFEGIYITMEKVMHIMAQGIFITPNSHMFTDFES